MEKKKKKKRFSWKIGKAVIRKDCIEWPEEGVWFYWWNWLPKDLRYWGYNRDWHDGPIYHLGLWYINMSWNLWWWMKFDDFMLKIFGKGK